MNNISNYYREMGVDAFYKAHAGDYTNPHADDIHVILSILWPQCNGRKKVLDLACGEGLVTKWVLNRYQDTQIEGIDKYMAERYTKETGKVCFTASFEDIVRDIKQLSRIHWYDIIVISYAIDLIPESYIKPLFNALALWTENIIIIRPNSKIIESSSFVISDIVSWGKANGVLYRRSAVYACQ